MSEENVEIARRAWEATNSRQGPDIDLANRLYHPEHELVSVTDRLEGGMRFGEQGGRDWFEEMDKAFESWEARIEEVTAIDDVRVLLLYVGTFQGKQSGAPTEQRGGAVITVRDRMVTRTEVFTSVDQALAAAGLLE